MKPNSVDEARPLGRHVAEQLSRHRFMAVSLSVHAGLLVLFYYFGSYRIEMAQQRDLLRTGAELSKRSSLEKRVLDMQQINDLLEQSGHAGAAPDMAQEQTNFSATSLPKTPEELLQEARQMSASIAEVEKRLKVDELARIEGISKDQALEQLDFLTLASAPAPATYATPQQLAAEIEQLEKRARASLAQRQQDLQRRIDGVAVQPPENESGNAYGAEPRTTVRRSAIGEQAKGGQVSTPLGRNEGEVVARIAKFINRDLALPKDVSQHYSRNGEMIFKPGVGHIPAVDTSSMRLGVGRMLGRGGEFANRVYINSWYLIGPFEGKHGSALFSNYRYPPEDGVVLDAAYRGKDNRVVKWRYLNADSYPLVPPDFAEDAVYYGYTELMLEREQDLTMWIGADDDARIWLNDEQVWVGGNVNKTSFWRDLYDTRNTYARDFNMTEGKRKVRFKKGRNKIFFKLANGPSRTFFSLVLTK